MDYLKAFVVGGIICVLTQILMEKTRLMPGRIMVILVTTGTVLGAIGLYEPLVQFAGAGASVPLTGFGNVLWKLITRASWDCSKVALQPVRWECQRHLYSAILPRGYSSLR